MLGLVGSVLLVAVWDSMDLLVVVVVCASPNAIRETIAGRREGTKVVGATAPGGTVAGPAAAVVVVAPVVDVDDLVVVGELVVLRPTPTSTPAPVPAPVPVVTVCGQ